MHPQKIYYMNHYETVFILNPVLSDDQIKETVKKYEDFLFSKGAKMVSKEDWGLKKLAYPIQNKKVVFTIFLNLQLQAKPLDNWRLNLDGTNALCATSLSN